MVLSEGAHLSAVIIAAAAADTIQDWAGIYFHFWKTYLSKRSLFTLSHSMLYWPSVNLSIHDTRCQAKKRL